MKLPKEKFDVLLRSGSINNSEIEASFSSDFQNFNQNITPDIVETYFNIMDKIMICKLCCIEINKALPYDHIKLKGHKDIENCFLMKCMTYCGFYDKGIKK